MQLVEQRRVQPGRPRRRAPARVPDRDPRGVDIDGAATVGADLGSRGLDRAPAQRPATGLAPEAVAGLRAAGWWRRRHRRGTTTTPITRWPRDSSRSLGPETSRPTCGDHVFRPAGMSSTRHGRLRRRSRVRAGRRARRRLGPRVRGGRAGHLRRRGRRCRLQRRGHGELAGGADQPRPLPGRRPDHQRPQPDRAAHRRRRSAPGTPSAGTPTDPPLPPTRLEHTGNLLTYSAYMEVLPASGYGVVVLLNAGSGLMLDQTGIFEGVREHRRGNRSRPSGPAEGTWNVRTLDTIIGLLTLVAVVIGARGVLGAGGGLARRRGQPRAYTAVPTASSPVDPRRRAALPRIAERLVAAARSPGKPPPTGGRR